jgi:hypothetical protein
MQTLVRLSASVVTIRTYSNPAEAAMGKSLLDSQDIFCRLADENVNLYGGGPLAMPIRLVVAEDQAQEAIRVLETKGLSFPQISILLLRSECKGGEKTLPRRFRLS